MILTDTEIIEALEEGALAFDPPLERDQIGATSIDLRLGYNFSTYPSASSALRENARSIVSETVDLGDESLVTQFISQLRTDNNKTLKDGDSIPIRPHSFLLAETLESVKLPANIAARVEGRSTYARLGIAIHQTAPSVKPNWSGQLTLEIVNNGPFTYLLYPRMRLCQLILERLSGQVQSLDRSTWENLRFRNR